MQDYFPPHESQCQCGCGKDIDPEFRKAINDLREAYGPMPVNSAARCKTHNEKEGGSPRSNHLKGMAIDVRMGSSVDAARMIGLALARGFSVGVYENFLHLDKGRPQQLVFRGAY